MIITKTTPFTKKEIETTKQQFEIYIKKVMDITKKICSAGCDLHTDSEKVLLKQGSEQQDVWGGGINLEKKIDFNSFINIRPEQHNTTIEIQDTEIKNIFEKQMKDFFKEIYE